MGYWRLRTSGKSVVVEISKLYLIIYILRRTNFPTYWNVRCGSDPIPMTQLSLLRHFPIHPLSIHDFSPFKFMSLPSNLSWKEHVQFVLHGLCFPLLSDGRENYCLALIAFILLTFALWHVVTFVPEATRWRLPWRLPWRLLWRPPTTLTTLTWQPHITYD